jgi:hypothetical protein
MKIRSRWFVLSGALGGLVGFALMEVVNRLIPGAGTRTGDILRMSIYFAGFGLAVGAALGMTEGVVLKKPGKLFYGLILGLLLGTIGGFAGGAIGQFIYGLAPLQSVSHSTADIAIALDSSGSMGRPWLLFWSKEYGHDVHGERKKAAKQLIERVGKTDRIAVVDFDDQAKLYYPLGFMDSSAAREAAQSAVDQVDDQGGTNLSAGLDACVEELIAKRKEGRKQYIIFLTDGQGYYTEDSQQRAKQAGITIYTVGLGDDVSADLLTSIAVSTGGKYYPVANASALTTLFEQIFTQNIDMTSRATGQPSGGTEPLTSPSILLFLRILSWAVMGLVIGLGQGVRENTREDLWACALGGLLGGAVGGSLFNPVTSLLTFGGGEAARAVADIVVAACIGGSMRLAQEKMVEASGKETTRLLAILPKKGALQLQPAPAAPSQASPRPVPAAQPPRPAPQVSRPQPENVTPKPAPPAPSRTAPTLSPTPAPAVEKGRLPEASPPASTPPRPPLSSFETGNGREQAMVLAYRSGHYKLGEIAAHFGVPASAVKRAADQLAPAVRER